MRAEIITAEETDLEEKVVIAEASEAVIVTAAAEVVAVEEEDNLKSFVMMSNIIQVACQMYSCL